MKNAVFSILFLTTIFSCNEKEQGFNDRLYDAILAYQKENPVPNSKDQLKSVTEPNSHPYNYVIRFDSDNNDTIIAIYLDPIGIGSDSNYYGVYHDKQLYPTLIMDNNKLGVKFINEYRKEGLSELTTENFDINDELYPIYFFKVSKNDMILVDKFKGNQVNK